MIEAYLKSISTTAEDWIKQNFKASDIYTEKLYEAMSYSLMAGGKRLRPGLLVMAYALFQDEPITARHPAMSFAAAVEMIHTYSLIHDDLPGMDNDDMRRGKPTNHIVYGEAAAILAGDGLLTKAFEVFLDTRSSDNKISMHNRAKAALIMLKACGPDGMVGGQYVDMLAQGDTGDIPEQARLSAGIMKKHKEVLDYIHAKKTAALISSSIQAGAVLAGAEATDIGNLAAYGDNIGLAFQIADDILDVTSSTVVLGKPVGSDERLDKLTYPKLYGIDASRKMLNQLIEGAVSHIESYGDKSILLKEMAYFIGNRRA